MFNDLFNNVFSQTQAHFSPSVLLLALLTSLLLGLLLATAYRHKTLYTKEFVVTLTLLPSLIAMIILMVNGNLGTSVAVAGTFSLIRFRSAAGGAKELLAIFMATASGIAVGMGYLFLAVAFTGFLSAVLFLFETFGFGSVSHTRRQLSLLVADEEDYETKLERFLNKFCRETECLSLKSLPQKNTVELEYLLHFKPQTTDKILMDNLRSYKGILEIKISKMAKKKKIL
ncbi:DUF4956 domain-containing protein [Streptococcus sp. H49]|uniref:DUF4956 domain-containing protein n=1 Tax=Streptococcus huangxiaojuni TaxID=3237239 RepID=UPI0034A35317